MDTTILFKNGELEVRKDIVEVMQEQAGRAAIFPIAKMGDYGEGELSLKSLVCNFHFLKDCNSYARLVECAYLMGAIKVYNSKIDKLEETELEQGLTYKQEQEKAFNYDVVDVYTDILDNVYTKEQKAFCQSDKLIKFISVYFSKDISCFSDFNGFTSFFNNLVLDKPVQVLRPLLEKVMNNFTVAEDDVYYSFNFHANTHLVDDCRRLYYKGRKVAKGRVKQTYDEKGNSIKSEIVLAVIEHLQRVGRKAYEEQEQAYKQEQEKAKAEKEKKAKQEQEQAKKVEKAKQEQEKAKAETKK